MTEPAAAPMGILARRRIEPVKQDDTHLEFNVTRCRYAERIRSRVENSKVLF
jgi:hypothetical protein